MPTLQHGVRPDAVGEVEDPLLAVLAALGNDVRGAELLGDLLAGLVPRHRDHPLGAELLRREDAAEAHGAVTDHDGRGAWADPGGDRGVPPGRHDVGQREQRRDQLLVGHPVGLHQRAVGLVDQGVLPWPPLVNPWCAHADVIPARQCGHVLSQCTNGTTTKSPG